jgi:hypothetical protein
MLFNGEAKKRGVGRLSTAPALATTNPLLQPSMPTPIETTIPLPAVAAALPLAAAPSAAAAAPSAAPVAAPSPADVFICRPTDRSSPPPPSAQAIKDAAAQEAHLSEAEDIAGSVNLSGGHRDINLDATTNLDPSPSSSAKKKKKAMSKKPLPASNASTHQVVEYYKQMKRSSLPCLQMMCS